MRNININVLAFMLRDMYMELDAVHAVSDIKVYITEAKRCIESPTIFVHMDPRNRGFFMVVDETEALTPTRKVYNGTRVYVKPELRDSRVLSEFYDILFKEFPDGDIIGLTVIQSKHIAVMEKRHKRIANLYQLNRS